MVVDMGYKNQNTNFSVRAHNFSVANLGQIYEMAYTTETTNAFECNLNFDNI